MGYAEGLYICDMVITDKYFVDVSKPVNVLAQEIMALPFADASRAMHTLDFLDYRNKTEYAANVARYIYANMPEYKEVLDKIHMSFI